MAKSRCTMTKKINIKSHMGSRTWPNKFVGKKEVGCRTWPFWHLQTPTSTYLRLVVAQSLSSTLALSMKHNSHLSQGSNKHRPIHSSQTKNYRSNLNKYSKGRKSCHIISMHGDTYIAQEFLTQNRGSILQIIQTYDQSTILINILFLFQKITFV